MSSTSSIDLATSRTITGHARLAGNTGGNEDDLGALEGSLDATVGRVGSVASDLSHVLSTSTIHLSIGLVSKGRTYVALGVNVADISGNAGSAANVEERELSDTGVELEEERQRLSDSTAGTEDGDLGELYGGMLSAGCARDGLDGH